MLGEITTIIIVVLGIIYGYCQVCGHETKQYITPNRSSKLKEDHFCDECHVRQTYKVK